MSRREIFYSFALTLAAVFGVLSVLYTTTLGVGLSEDSLIYLDSAGNLLEGNGLTYELQSGLRNPLIIFPPGFPFLVTFLGLFGLPATLAARWLGAFSLGASVLLVGLLIRRSMKKLGGFSILGSVLILTSADMLFIHSMAWSEPPFLALFLVVILLLDIYFQKERRPILLAAACAMGVAFLTRYAGVILLATSVLVIAFRKGWPVRRRILDSVIFGVVSCIPVFLWGVRNRMITGDMTDREMVFHLISARNILPAIETVGKWIVPHDAYKLGIFQYALPVLILGSAILWIVSIRRTRPSTSEGTPSSVISNLTGGFICLYLLFLVFWVSFFDADPQIGFRYLAPVFVCAVIFACSLAHRVSRGIETRNFRIISMTLGISIAAWFISCSAFWVTKTHDRGMGYSRRSWKESPVLLKALSMNPQIRVYTNAVAPLRIYDPERAVLYIPKKYSRRTLVENESYMREMQQVRDEIVGCRAVLLWFDRRSYRGMTNEHELMQDLRLERVARENDGTILGVPQCVPEIFPTTKTQTREE